MLLPGPISFSRISTQKLRWRNDKPFVYFFSISSLKILKSSNPERSLVDVVGTSQAAKTPGSTDSNTGL